MPVKKLAAPGITDAPETVRSAFATVDEAKTFLHVSRAHVYSLMDRGELTFARFGACRRIPWAALHQYVARCTVAAS